MVYAMYFSPNGTGLRTLKNIVEGMQTEPVWTDLSVPENRQRDYAFQPEDLVLYCTMTAGMLYAKNREIFSRLKGNGAAFAGIAMYGNGYYGVSLRQLKKRASACGFNVVALAAFIGQHAQAGDVAAGRPDEKDTALQRQFGESIASKREPILNPVPVGWSSSPLFNSVVCARLFMQGQDYVLPGFMKAKEKAGCIGCGICAQNCPAEAIQMKKGPNGLSGPTFDSRKCIDCYRCINSCPKKAITCKSALMNGIVKRFGSRFHCRKEPTIVL